MLIMEFIRVSVLMVTNGGMPLCFKSQFNWRTFMFIKDKLAQCISQGQTKLRGFFTKGKFQRRRYGKKGQCS